MSSEIFREHKTCETRGQCVILGECQRAMNIKIEMRYEKKSPGLSSLRYILDKRRCEHKEAIDAASDAIKLLENR